MRTRGLCLAVGVAALWLAAKPATGAADDLAAAKANYVKHCAVCHGKSGKGDGPGAMTLTTKPRDFTDCARMKAMPDDALFNVIKNGGAAAGKSKDMQAWKDQLSDPEIHGLVAYVRTLCEAEE